MNPAFSVLLVVAMAATSASANRCANEVNGVTLPSPDACERYSLCFNKMEINLECPIGHWYDIVSNSCRPEAEATCYKQDQVQGCPKDGISTLPHPDKCERYFICSDGVMIERSCFEGLHWNAVAEQCMEPALAGCLPQDESPVHSCPAVNVPGEVVFIPNPQSCTRFYVCFNGQPMERECAAGLYWEQPISKCVPAEQSTCRVAITGGPADITDEVVGEVVEEIVNYDELCKGLTFDILSHPESRRRFIVCVAGKATERRCRRGTRFNKAFRACMPGRKQTPQ